MKFEKIQNVQILSISQMPKIKGGTATKSVGGAHGGQADDVDAQGNVTYAKGGKGKVIK